MKAIDERLCVCLCACVGDFFKDRLPEVDLYVLARILHDWTDLRSIELLTKVYHACKPGALHTQTHTRTNAHTFTQTHTLPVGAVLTMK